ncbi:uncharacterized protein LOC123672871 [Harmonia axyridis]|uniref:uncharacterized protein LOC123672871 n=1 Tax=Harmonia axyridis TaxID=115357 RepID=UPI001E2779BD|nr:uncharacterized protein LOC123672871 [Harmonia axyridis]
MDSEGEEIPETTELLSQDQDESEDYSTFFLQPASCPYNIAEKVEEANVALHNASLNSEKSARVRFKEDLVSFDAQLTDDDVVSIESDHAELPFMEQQKMDQTIVFEYKTNNTNMFSIDEDCEDEIIEDIECELEGVKEKDSNKGIAEPETKVIPHEDKQIRENETPDSNTSGEFKTKNKCRKKSPKFINCKYHCIERIETELSDAIRKLSLYEKPPVCPPLKLIDRKCCTRNHKRNPTSLPKYQGLRSEYGLSIEQITRRQKIKEMIRSREEKRQELIKEYEKKREEVNEQVFCDWLKKISDRKHRVGFKEFREGLNKPPPPSRPVSSSKTSSRAVGSSKSTSESGYSSKTSSEKNTRARSGGQNVYVEVPRNVLQRGITVENLLNSFGQSKKLYITTVS